MKRKLFLLLLLVVTTILFSTTSYTNAATHSHTSDCYNGATAHEHDVVCYAIGCTTCSGTGYKYTTYKNYGNVNFSTPVAYCDICGTSCAAPSRSTSAKKNYESCRYCSYSDFTQTFEAEASCGHGSIEYVYYYYHSCSYYGSSANVSHSYSTTGDLKFRSSCSKCQSSSKTLKCGKTAGAYYNSDGTAANVICDKKVTGITSNSKVQTIIY